MSPSGTRGGDWGTDARTSRVTAPPSRTGRPGVRGPFEAAAPWQAGCHLEMFALSRFGKERSRIPGAEKDGDAPPGAPLPGFGRSQIFRKAKEGFTPMEFRRRVPRQIANWVGSCHIEGEPAEAPRPCRVLDVSELGLGIVIDHPRGSALVGRHVAVETPPMGTSVNIRLEGEVRNAVALDAGSVRLGIEFDGLVELEQSVLNALSFLSAPR
jgi:PilZ domain